MTSHANLHANHDDCLQILLYNAVGICLNGCGNGHPIAAEHCIDPVLVWGMLQTRNRLTALIMLFGVALSGVALAVAAMPMSKNEKMLLW